MEGNLFPFEYLVFFNKKMIIICLSGRPGDLNDDTLNDKRNDYIENEVTMDYNAGFQSLLAGLLQKAC